MLSPSVRLVLLLVLIGAVLVCLLSRWLRPKPLHPCDVPWARRVLSAADLQAGHDRVAAVRELRRQAPWLGLQEATRLAYLVAEDSEPDTPHDGGNRA